MTAQGLRNVNIDSGVYSDGSAQVTSDSKGVSDPVSDDDLTRGRAGLFQIRKPSGLQARAWDDQPDRGEGFARRRCPYSRPDY